jgi:DNA-binding GntR family transcriptional regulator
MLDKVPGALSNAAYITFGLAFGVIGYKLAFAEGQLFREGLFRFMTSFLAGVVRDRRGRPRGCVHGRVRPSVTRSTSDVATLRLAWRRQSRRPREARIRDPARRHFHIALHLPRTRRVATVRARCGRSCRAPTSRRARTCGFDADPRLQPGQQFSIGELCAELDVSHIPVREALRRLEADGLVILRPSRSAIVTPLSLDELDEVYRLRLAIEPTLAARSAPSYTNEALEEAERLCEQLRVPDGTSRGRAGGEAHARLHELLLSPASGPLSRRILRRLWHVSERYTSWVYDVWPLAHDEPYRLHLELVEIAKELKGPKMRKAIVDHLTESRA